MPQYAAFIQLDPKRLATTSEYAINLLPVPDLRITAKDGRDALNQCREMSVFKGRHPVVQQVGATGRLVYLTEEQVMVKKKGTLQ